MAPNYIEEISHIPAIPAPGQVGGPTLLFGSETTLMPYQYPEIVHSNVFIVHNTYYPLIIIIMFVLYFIYYMWLTTAELLLGFIAFVDRKRFVYIISLNQGSARP